MKTGIWLKRTIAAVALSTLAWCELPIWQSEEVKSSDENQASQEELQKNEDIVYIGNWVRQMIKFWVENLWIKIDNHDYSDVTDITWAYFSNNWFIGVLDSYSVLNWEIDFEWILNISDVWTANGVLSYIEYSSWEAPIDWLDIFSSDETVNDAGEESSITISQTRKFYDSLREWVIEKWKEIWQDSHESGLFTYPSINSWENETVFIQTASCNIISEEIRNVLWWRCGSGLNLINYNPDTSKTKCEFDTFNNTLTWSFFPIDGDEYVEIDDPYTVCWPLLKEIRQAFEYTWIIN